MKSNVYRAGWLCLGLLLPDLAFAAEGLDGAHLPVALGVPFAGILLSIALGPMLAPKFWHHHYGKVAAFWSVLVLAGLVLAAGSGATLAALFHTFALEYLPFILMLFALFTAAGGIVVSGNLHGAPVLNTALLAVGAGAASFIGTTGASMVLIRPLLRANDNRRHNAHVVIFFIFLVSNIGGALTPLGDPPLFLGFLRGVDFFWTMKTIFPQTLTAVGILLVVFFLLDSWLYKNEGVVAPDATPDSPLRVTGLVNFALILIAIGAIILSGVWKPGWDVTILGTKIEIQNVVREAVMIFVGLASLALTNTQQREANGFEWEPIVEVAKIFAGIFITIIPVIAMLQAGKAGPFAGLLGLVSKADGSPNNVAYFWLTGILSSFLDNAPTYLVFFEMAGGNVKALMGPLANTLAAISLGAVFMGANTYLGNAPNFMVYAIARSNGVKMPGFFGYMLWSFLILIPLFILIQLLFVR